MTHPTPWAEPFERFGEVFAEATAKISQDPNAVSLATVDARGRPTVRVVLLKGYDQQGFVFYTNTRSTKGRALGETRVAALNFYWPALARQVRVEGLAEPVSDAEADDYFATRPRSSQLGAWASHQSEVLTDRSELEARLAETTRRFEGRPVPRPPHWSGFRVRPDRIEFWRAHEFRLHWREAYVKAGDGWQHQWLNP